MARMARRMVCGRDDFLVFLQSVRGGDTIPAVVLLAVSASS